MNGSDNTKYVIIFCTILFLLGVFSFTLFLKSNELNDVSVSDEKTPPAEEVIISNLSSNSAVVSWYTNIEAIGFIKLGEDPENLNIEINTIGDTSTSRTPKKVHYARITGLEPEKDYYFELYINNQAFRKANNELFTFRTFKTTTLVTPKTLRISLPNEFRNGVVYAHASDGSTISTVSSTTATNNNVSLQLTNLKTNTGEDYDLDGAGILISATSETGQRYSEIVEIKEEIIQINAESNTIAYNPETVFQPKNVIAQELPNTEQPEPVPIQSPTPQMPSPIQPTPTPEPSPTPTPQIPYPSQPIPTPEPSPTPPPQMPPNTQTLLPNTALNPKTLLAAAPLFFGLGLIFLGVTLISTSRIKS